MFNFKTLSMVAAVALAPVAASAATISIDSFDTPQTAITPAGSGIGTSSTIAAPEAIGGQRTITVTGDGDLFPIVTTSINIAGGNVSISNSEGVTGAGLFEWTAGGVDLTDGGTNDNFVLEVNSVDTAVSFDLTIDGYTASHTAVSTSDDVLFDFMSFGDLTDANEISLLVYGPAAFDANFSFLGAEDLTANPVSPVPLPAGGLLLGSILLGAGFMARRKA